LSTRSAIATFVVVREDRRFADGRAARRDRSGIEAGAVSGGVLGLLLGSMLPAVGSLVGAAAAALVGAAAGAAAGKAVAARISVDEWDRGPSDRPYVGAHTPDEDGVTV
jgi:hypothetical protein